MNVFQGPPNRVIRYEDGRTITPSTRPNNHYYAFYVAVIQDRIITTMSTIPSNVVTIDDGMLDGDEIRLLQEALANSDGGTLLRDVGQLFDNEV